jgi:hypothetical protein
MTNILPFANIAETLDSGRSREFTAKQAAANEDVFPSSLAETQ